MIQIDALPSERWEEARELRLKALQTDPSAFGSAFEEEQNMPKEEWQRRMKSAIFALDSDCNKPVGTITFVFGDHVKSKHIAKIFAVYVDPAYRGRGIGSQLFRKALEAIQKNKEILKIQLMVNSEQQAAVALYKSMGFETVGRLSKEIKVGERYYDELVMEKLL